jgi:hypothetical protein
MSAWVLFQQMRAWVLFRLDSHYEHLVSPNNRPYQTD